MNVRSDWNHYAYTYGEGHAAEVAFDVASAVFSDAQYGHGVRMLFEAPTDQAVLAGLLGDVDCLLVGRLSYAGRVEYVLQVADLSALRSVEPALISAGATVQYTEGWAYFDERVCPTPADWRRIQDREALERLDLDGDGELRILHRFFGDEEALDAIWARLEGEGFDSVERGDKQMALAHAHPMNDVSRITVGLLRLSEHHGALYDGWVLPG